VDLAGDRRVPGTAVEQARIRSGARLTFASLLTSPSPSNPNQEPTFSFEHAMSHRRLLGAMAPLTRFSVIPYGPITPGYNTGDWHLDHEQAHDDFQLTIPGWFGIPTSGIINPVYPLVETDFRNEDQLKWWTFHNFQEHLTGENALNWQEEFTFPFW
jgi:hypothetical protein